MSENPTALGKPHNPAKERMANLELLRIVAMLLIVVLHFLGKGGWLTPLPEASMPHMGYVAWGLEALAIGSLNVYMLLSGYFLIESSFKVKRLLQLLLQVLFYSIGTGLLAAAFGCLPEEGFSIYYLASLFLPLSTEHYWFMTAYFMMYLFVPFLSQGVKRLTKKQFQTVLVLLLTLVCIIKSVVPVKLPTDRQGYDCIWYMCVFLVAAYIRLYGIPFFKNIWRSLLAYFGAGAGIFALAFVLRFLYLRTGRLRDMLSVSYNYNHILTLLAAVALFYVFYHMRIKQGVFSRFVCRIAPYTLGVYLWHEHEAIRYEWQNWFYFVAAKPDNGVMLVPYTLLAALLVFAVGIVLDVLRSLLFRGLHLLFSHVGVYRRLCQWLDTLVIKA